MAMSAVYTNFGGRIVHEKRGSESYRHCSDPLGSSVAVIDTSDGSTMYEAEYWPYGEVQTETGTNLSSLGFVGLLGYFRDLVSLLYVRARHYLTQNARWLTVDPLWPRERALGYVNGDPVFQSDPSGMAPVLGILAGIAAICVTAAIAAMLIVQGRPYYGQAGKDPLMHCVAACIMVTMAGPACGLGAMFGSEVIQAMQNMGGADRDVSWIDVINNTKGAGCGTVLHSCFIPKFFPVVSCEACCGLVLGSGGGSGMGDGGNMITPTPSPSIWPEMSGGFPHPQSGGRVNWS